MTEAEILEFAGKFDPPADPRGHRRSRGGRAVSAGIIGSGWHSAGLAMRLIADHYLSRVASLASPGVDELRWRVPLRPGDTVRLRTTIAETRPSRTKPDRGLVITQCELINADGGVPVAFRAMNFLARRPAQPAGAQRGRGLAGRGGDDRGRTDGCAGPRRPPRPA